MAPSLTPPVRARGSTLQRFLLPLACSVASLSLLSLFALAPSGSGDALAPPPAPAGRATKRGLVWVAGHTPPLSTVYAGYPGGAGGCAYTHWTSDAVVDSKGVTCGRASLLPTGCCGTPSSGGGGECDADARCCDSYTACVAACLTPGMEEERQGMLASLAKSGAAVYRDVLEPAAAAWPGTGGPAHKDAFGLCTQRCNPSPWSTQFESEYRAPLHHCYSFLRPSLSAG